MRIRRLEAPGGAPALALTDADILEGSLERIPLDDQGLPSYRVTVRGGRNHTIQTNSLAGAVGAARRARLAQPYQDGIATDTGIKTAYLLATELTVETGIQCLTAIQAEAARLLALYGVKRDRFELAIRATPGNITAVELGAVVEITSSRFQLFAGRLFRIIGFQVDPQRSVINLTVWG
jgi:hypothetical protein